MKLMRTKYNDALKEKMDLTDLIMQQEENMRYLTNQIQFLEETIKSKNGEIKEVEQNCFKMLRIIEDQKRSVSLMNQKLKKRDSEDEHRKIVIAEKDQEIHFLKNFINTLKSDNQCIINCNFFQ